MSSLLGPTDPAPLIRPWSACLLFGLALGGDASAAEARLRWDAVVDPRVARYEIYVGEASGAYGRSLAVTEATALVWGLLPQRMYFFSVRACDQAGLLCSALSNEVIGLDADGDGVLEELCWACLPGKGGWRAVVE